MDAAPLWVPGEHALSQSRIARFQAEAAHEFAVAIDDYATLHRLSIDHRAEFWSKLWDFAHVIGGKGETILVNPDAMPGARWFPQARLNFAENLLRGHDDKVALIYRDERGTRSELTMGALRRQVFSAAQRLGGYGVTHGDRVAAMAPNCIETVTIMLAATSLGAVWSSCSPDFGADAVVDRFAQIEPKVLITCDGYSYNGRWYDLRDKTEAIRARLPSVERLIVIRLGDDDLQIDAIAFSDLTADAARPAFTPCAFDDPLFIMFSSGTTGSPKCIVHSVGGSLLQLLKEHRLHCDLGADDRLLYFTTCGWMMWNWLVSALASEVTVCLYEGSPFHPDREAVLRYIDEERLTCFGTSPGYLSALAKENVAPRELYELRALTQVLSTGSPLAAELFEWFYAKFKPGARLASISGGTDIMGCFALGVPTLPVYAGELQGPALGMAVEFWDENGQALERGRGELVCTRAFPSMPVSFWNDPKGEKYHDAYFGVYAGVWHHGDFGEYTEHGGIVIHGRSDAVLNRGGVRIGTAELYRQVEKLDPIMESLAVAQEWQGDVRVILFVKLRDGMTLDDAMREEIRSTIRSNTSPRHVPDLIIQVPDLPRTRSGKLVELAVRNVIHGEPVRNVGALANPDALKYFENLPELK
jgi:acetoacetyl-CoA synthetase